MVVAGAVVVVVVAEVEVVVVVAVVAVVAVLLWAKAVVASCVRTPASVSMLQNSKVHYQ